MRIRQLQTFCDLAQTLNFTQTAQRLHYAQSSVVEQIDALENHFGVPLFSRQGRRLQLTPHGRQLLDDAERIVAIATDARRRLRGGGPAAPIVVMAPETFCARRLPRILREYQLCYPGSTVEVRAADRATLATAVAERKADICIMLGIPGDTPAPTAEDGVRCTLLAKEALVLVGAAGHPLASRPAGLQEAAEFPIYATPPGCAFRAAGDAALGPLQLQPSMVSDSISVLVETVAATQGLAVLPELAVEQAIAERRLAAIVLSDRHWPAVPVLMAWRGTAASPHVQRFAQLAQACFDVAL